MVAHQMIVPTGAHPTDGVPAAFALGLRTGFGSDRLALGAMKAWLDGGIMARTAALSSPYSGAAPGNRGELADDLDQVTDTACAAHAAGWQLALHAIGDRAIDAALEIIERAQAQRRRPDARHRIEHCGLVRPDQLPRLAALGVTAVIQPGFLHEFGDDYADVLGAERAPWLYRARTFLQHGIALAGSSDRLVADGAPLRAVQFLVQRRSAAGNLIGDQERLDVRQALHAYTVGAAAACHAEHRVGSLAPGKHADLVVLQDDPMRVPADELAAIPVRATVVGVDLVYGSWST